MICRFRFTAERDREDGRQQCLVNTVLGNNFFRKTGKTVSELSVRGWRGNPLLNLIGGSQKWLSRLLSGYQRKRFCTVY